MTKAQRVEAHVLLDNEDSGDVNESREAALTRIREYCLKHVPFARAPRNYHGWPDFPLKANGKTDKQELISMVDTPEG